MFKPEDFKGEFFVSTDALKHKLISTQLLVFDWDGVFNNGNKSATNGSGFSEPDSMGLNLLRFSFWLETGAIIPIIVITGEPNESAKMLAMREKFNAIYYGVKQKDKALNHYLEGQSGMHPNNAAMFFDDVIDLSIAQQAGLRIMINRAGPQTFINYVKSNNLADYLTYNYGGLGALREAFELLLSVQGNLERTIEERVQFSARYKEYLDARQQIELTIYKAGEKNDFIKQ